MNPDYTSDIRLVDRFIFENSIYLLTMFQKKIDSFTTNTNKMHKMTKIKEKETLLASKKPIDPDQFIKNPKKTIQMDKTKPIWDCITSFPPRVLINASNNKQKLQVIRNIGHLIDTFMTRYKNQHEDQSNLRINIIKYDLHEESNKLNQVKEGSEGHYFNFMISTTQNLFQLLIASITGKQDSQQSSMEDERIPLQYKQQNLQQILRKCTKQLFSCYSSQQHPQFSAELNSLIKIVTHNIGDVLDVEIGPLVISLMSPRLSYLPLLIHPMLFCLYNIIKFQLSEIFRKQQQKNQRKFPNKLHQPYNQDSSSKDKDNSYVYGQIKSEHCSKFVFINLDGYESEFNVEIAKYLAKNILYVSFPRESRNTNLNEEVYDIEMQRSQRLLRKYFYYGLTQEQKKTLLNKYKQSDREAKKNLYMFPIHSKFLQKKFGLQSIQNYESTFIAFIMKQLIYDQILDFNPSCIIVSYSGKLQMDNSQFTEIMKELTVLGNYKVLFYANTCKNYIFEQQLYSEMKQCKNFMNFEKKYYDIHEKGIQIISQNRVQNINCDLFEKMSMAMKITSGTYNLSRPAETQNYTRKYKNHKVMKYTSELINIIGNQNYNLSRMKTRHISYASVIRVQQMIYKNKSDTYDKLFGKVITKYHHSLLKTVQKIILSQEDNLLSDEKLMKICNGNSRLRSLINQKYDSIDKKSVWHSLKFQYSLEISTQKTQTHVFVHIPRTNNYTNSDMVMNKSNQNLLCLQFQTFLDKQRISSAQIAPYTGLYYSQIRKHQNAIIYVINHLPKTSSVQYHHFYGVINPLFDSKLQPRVQLRPFVFDGVQILPFYQTYTQFNYFETKDYLFLFWPKIYDSVKELMSRMAGVKYIPQITSLFFRAHRSSPQIVSLLNIENPETYGDILPRSGCTCYQVEQCNTIYIFGGFYGDQQNYLKFQTDITCIKYKHNTFDSSKDPFIQIENIPKTFYFEYQSIKKEQQMMQEQVFKQYRINLIKNDVIRPKIQYQILPCENQNNQNQKSIFLIGGAGQKFVRSYSLIGHMAHKIVFNSNNGQLLSIRRIPMNTVVPINIRNPVKTRCPLNLGIVTNAQNRSINLVEGSIGVNGQVLTRNKITYSPKQQRFYFQTQYQLGEIQHRSYREQVSFLKRSVVQTQNRSAITVKRYRGKQFNKNFITLTTTQNQKKYLFLLQLQLPLEARVQNPQLAPVQKLTGLSIISIDISGALIFALIRHPILTLDKCILTMFDINELSGKLLETKNAAIQMKQIYKFDQNVSRNIIIAANNLMIAILHGQRFEQEKQVPQIILVRTKKNQIKIHKVLPSQINVDSQQQKQGSGKGLRCLLNKKIAGGINSSLFLNKKDGIILCFSFKTIKRKEQGDANLQKLLIIIQKLNMTDDKYKWETIYYGEYYIRINSQENTSRHKRQTLKLVEITTIPNQNANNQILLYQYQITALSNTDQCLKATINFINHNINIADSNNNGQNIVVFEPQNINSQQYYKQLQNKIGKQQCILLEKHSYLYTELNQQKYSLNQ